MPVHEDVCTITAKGQTTVPESVRKALGVDDGGRIAFRVHDGLVTVHGIDAAADPALLPFLHLLAHDLVTRPSAIRALDEDLVTRMGAAQLIDPDAPIEGSVSL